MWLLKPFGFVAGSWLIGAAIVAANRWEVAYRDVSLGPGPVYRATDIFDYIPLGFAITFLGTSTNRITVASYLACSSNGPSSACSCSVATLAYDVSFLQIDLTQEPNDPMEPTIQQRLIVNVEP